MVLPLLAGQVVLPRRHDRPPQMVHGLPRVQATRLFQPDLPLPGVLLHQRVRQVLVGHEVLQIRAVQPIRWVLLVHALHRRQQVHGDHLGRQLQWVQRDRARPFLLLVLSGHQYQLIQWVLRVQIGRADH